MLISHRWLCELLPDLDREPEEIAEALSAVGLAVDGLQDLTCALREVIIANVTGVEPHPSRDQLQLVSLRTRAPGTSIIPGDSLGPAPGGMKTPSTVTVVCGASNVPPVGGQVVFAGLGVRLPGVDFVLEPRKIGGVESHGMLCSESELGLAETSAGIMTFEPDTFELGTRLVDAIPETGDAIFEIDVTPNRPDALGHVGVARDLAAFFDIPFQAPVASSVPEQGAPASSQIRVQNDDPDRCPRYGAGIVRGVKLAPSPDWMRWRLFRLGVRPISNVVDVTNWLLLEYGQPLHAFDLARVRGGTIVVRRADEGETITTLDQEKRILTRDDLLICDRQGPTALAGIMGGADSEIGDQTQDVLLECAYFLPQGIRRTARRLGMHTESSHRFERGTDHGITQVVLDRARSLLCEYAGGKAAPGTVRDDGAPIELPRIWLRTARVEALLGVSVPVSEMTRSLSRLGFGVEFVRDLSDDHSECSIRGASHRPDVTMEHDLIDEVARIRGLDAIPTVLPAIAPQEPRSAGQLERRAAQIGAALGLSEALTYSFVSEGELEDVYAPAPVVRLANPLSEERSVLRTSLLPGLLEAYRRATRRGERRVQLFSIGAVFLPIHKEQPVSEARPRLPEDAGRLPIESPRFTALLAGPRPEFLSLKPQDYDVYDAKGIAIEMVERLTSRRTTVEYVGAHARTRHLHPRGAARVLLEGMEVGLFGPLHPDLIDRFDLDGTAQIIELDLALIEAKGTVTPRYSPIPKLPPLVRDISLVVSEDTPAAAVMNVVRSASGELCESVEVMAEFRGGSVPEGSRSLTLRVIYRDPNARLRPEQARTLTDKEVDGIVAKALEKADRDLGATLRG